MKKCMLTSLVLLANLMCLVAPATADLPPPPWYVETCTLENQQLPEEECQICHGHFNARDGCQKELGPSGYRFRCKAWGASHWDEVWCRPSAPRNGEGE
jgi:hypothetical protein